MMLTEMIHGLFHNTFFHSKHPGGLFSQQQLAAPTRIILTGTISIYLLLRNLGDHGKPCTNVWETLVSQIIVNVSYAYQNVVSDSFMMYVLASHFPESFGKFSYFRYISVILELKRENNGNVRKCSMVFP